MTLESCHKNWDIHFFTFFRGHQPTMLPAILQLDWYLQENLVFLSPNQNIVKYVADYVDFFGIRPEPFNIHGLIRSA